MWTILLVSVGCLGLYFAPRRWWGWGITSAGELLWVAYASVRHDHPLFVMAWIWLALNLRGCYVARKAYLQSVRPVVHRAPRHDLALRPSTVPRLRRAIRDDR